MFFRNIIQFVVQLRGIHTATDVLVAMPLCPYGSDVGRTSALIGCRDTYTLCHSVQFAKMCDT